jgi:hypothetical protein
LTQQEAPEEKDLPRQFNEQHQEETLLSHPQEHDDEELGHVLTWENDPTKVHFLQQAKDLRHRITQHLTDNPDCSTISINSRRSYAVFQCLDQDHVTKPGEKELLDEEGRLKYAFGMELKYDDELPDGVLRLE